MGSGEQLVQASGNRCLRPVESGSIERGRPLAAERILTDQTLCRHETGECALNDLFRLLEQCSGVRDRLVLGKKDVPLSLRLAERV